MIQIELLRGKGFPQTEDDPNPCTTQARVSIMSSGFEQVIGAEQCSSVQEQSNAPFYKDILTFPVDASELKDAAILIKIAEFSRKDEPFIMFYGEHRFELAGHDSKKELVIPLTQVNPVEDPEAAALELESSQNAANGERTTLSLRLSVRKATPAVNQSTDADVELKAEDIALKGATQLVPAQCEYVWLRLVSDKHWSEAFRYALSVTWRNRSLLTVTAGAVRPKPTARMPGKKTSIAAPVLEAEARTIGDVVVKKWGCTRIHQVLSRVRLSAEKFSKGESTIVFTPEEEVAYRTEKKTRAMILETMAVESLTKSDASNLRDWLERLWVLFSVGIDNDPAGGKALSYDVRRQVRDSGFEADDIVLVLASFLYFFLPSLPFEDCQSIAEHDVRSFVPEVSPQEGGDQPKWESRLTAAQKLFTITVISFVGPLIETLTETELLRALKAFKPAVLDAHRRVAKGGKNGIQLRLLRADSARLLKGEGIPIKHLDKLGRRKEQSKFV